MHGYHGSNHLNAMMTYEDRKTATNEYMATVLWSIGRMLGGDGYSLPTYDQFLHPKQEDNRTKDQIVNGLIEKLRKGVHVDGGDGTVSGSGKAGA